jgi:hypothetical protein
MNDKEFDKLILKDEPAIITEVHYETFLASVNGQPPEFFYINEVPKESRYLVTVGNTFHWSKERCICKSDKQLKTIWQVLDMKKAKQ